ncbi:MAG: hypothetical protein CMN56_02125 [Sneathiella sp.]|uniref:hypothetical protein n=1 Tax=Sneathiella sp. TaxID=1964365 RepID=UPI000C50D96B|nr:hypothetical protein [Sneathiella sp.]MAZ01913.1 hypothetical protein [Sneathiella sp.]
MAVSTDTIQTLLRQRQQLREALLELRKEIESLDATSLDLVNSNIKNVPSATATTPGGEATPAGSVPERTAATAPAAAASTAAPVETKTEAKAAPTTTPAPAVKAPAAKAPDPAPVQTAPPAPVHTPAPAPEPVAAAPEPTPAHTPAPVKASLPAQEAAPKAPEPAPAPVAPPAAETEPPEPERQEPVLTAPEAAPEKESEKEQEKTHEKSHDKSHEKSPEKADEKHAHKAMTEREIERAWEDGTAKEEEAFGELLTRARILSNYFLDHPASSTPAELGALDSAITISERAKTPAEKTACYHTLQAAYRKISAANFGTLGLNGKTLQDSQLGAPLLWTIPLSISLLIFVFFPLLLLARHLAAEMFTDDFANDLTWSIWLIAAYLWGTVGALSLLTLNIAIEVRKRRYDEAVRLSPGLRGALGGLTGAGFFLALEPWLPMTGAAQDFALDLAAFLGGMLSMVLFAGLQRMISAITGRLEPAKPKPSAAAKK